MLITRAVIVLPQNSDGICDIGPSGGHRVHKASDHQLVYGRMAGFFVGLPLLKLHCHQRGNWPSLVHSELRQVRPNVAVLMDFNLVMLLIAIDVHTKIAEDPCKVMYPEPCVHLILDLPNQALVSNDKEVIDVQNDPGNYTLILIVEYEMSAVDG
jgi:hypothetical protein